MHQEKRIGDKYNFEKESTNSWEAFFGEQVELTRIEKVNTVKTATFHM